jgi:hypothetical protein
LMAVRTLAKENHRSLSNQISWILQLWLSTSPP